MQNRKCKYLHNFHVCYLDNNILSMLWKTAEKWHIFRYWYIMHIDIAKLITSIYNINQKSFRYTERSASATMSTISLIKIEVQYIHPFVYKKSLNPTIHTVEVIVLRLVQPTINKNYCDFGFFLLCLSTNMDFRCSTEIYSI